MTDIHSRALRTRGPLGLLAVTGLVLALSACTSTRPAPGAGAFQQCVPFARAESGVQIRGDAKTWWNQAEGRYSRGKEPRPGAVLVLRADKRLPSGHVAVVSGVHDSRTISVDHANWGWDARTRGRVYRSMPAMDVSANNDWSEIRFRHPDVGAFGRPYPAHGFIYRSTSVASLP